MSKETSVRKSTPAMMPVTPSLFDVEVPAVFEDMLGLADKSWRKTLREGLEAVAQADPDYLPALAKAPYLPTRGRLFAAFSQPMDKVRYVLVGEGPYPREGSATGFCFMDGAVHSLWSEKGLSKPVNRATSLRNFMKMLLVAGGFLKKGGTGGEHLAEFVTQVHREASPFIGTRAELQDNLTAEGFLLLNATLVFRPHAPPVKDAKAWRPFLRTVLHELAAHADAAHVDPPSLVLWGKIAEEVNSLEISRRFPKLTAEHPYNLSFIDNQGMQQLFGPMHLLMRKTPAK